MKLADNEIEGEENLVTASIMDESNEYSNAQCSTAGTVNEAML